MTKAAITFEDFLTAVPAEHTEFVKELYAYLFENNCQTTVKQARSGYMVSCSGPDGKALFNYIFRKTGMMIRIYADHISQYPALPGTFPASMMPFMEKASVCKRMIDPAACNQRCRMGYDYYIGEKRFQKCRNSAFQFPLNSEYYPCLQEMVKKEIQTRK